MQWYYSAQDQQKGPIEEVALDELVSAGVVRDETLVWHEGMSDWQTHASVRGPRSASAVPAAGDTRYCSECGRPFLASELVTIGPRSVCAECKPIYLQKMREGGMAAVGVHRYGGFWIRFAARIIDGIIIQIAIFAVVFPLGALLGTGALLTDPEAAGGPLAGGAMILFTILIYGVSIGMAASYEIFFLLKRGATPGKLALGLKVIRPDGASISFGLAIGRYFAQFLSSITLGIGYIMVGFDEQKRSLHDRVCETRVVYTK